MGSREKIIVFGLQIIIIRINVVGHCTIKGGKRMSPEQEMIEGLKLAAGAGVFIGLVAIGLALSSALGT